MSRVAKAIVTIPAGVDVSINADPSRSRARAAICRWLERLVTIGNNDGKLSFAPATTPVKLTLWPVPSASWSTTWSRA
jgi:large subunit ribosomal protein L6